MTSIGAGQFGGDGRQHDAGIRRPAVDELGARRGEKVRGMGALAHRRQHRPLQVQAERHGAPDARSIVEPAHAASAARRTGSAHVITVGTNAVTP